MFNKSVKNTLLLGIAAALLNYSFAIAQPANPPSSGALTPNFTGLNVSGDAQVGGSLRTDYITTQDPTATEVIFGTDIFTEQNLTVSDDTTTTSLLTRNIRPLANETDVNVLGNLKTDSIGEKTTGNGTRFSNGIIVSGQVSGQTFGGGSAVFGSLETSVDATVGGTLNVDTIEANGARTTFPGDIQVNGNSSANYLRLRGESGTSLRADSDVQLYGDLELDGSFFIQGIDFLSFLKNRISVVRGTKSQSQYTYATCPSGQIAISCGNDTDSLSSRVVESFRATIGGDPSDQSCRTVWASASYNQGSVAICFDY